MEGTVSLLVFRQEDAFHPRELVCKFKADETYLMHMSQGSGLATGWPVYIEMFSKQFLYFICLSALTNTHILFSFSLSFGNRYPQC